MEMFYERSVKIQEKRPGLSWLFRASTLALSVPVDLGVKFAEDIWSVQHLKENTKQASGINS